jgi:hypothetical protein
VTRKCPADDVGGAFIVTAALRAEPEPVGAGIGCFAGKARDIFVIIEL